MSLKDLTLSLLREEVKLADGQKFTVRGLSLTDIATLVQFHGPRLRRLYEDFVTDDGEGNIAVAAENSADFAAQFVIAAPGVAAHIIALAARDADEEPQFDVALMLPVDVQVDALDKAIRCTFRTEGGAKKVMETVLRAFGGIVNFSGLTPKT